MPEEEAFYGGAAGGGKSEALLIGAAMYLEESDYHSIIFRKKRQTLKLEGGLIPRSKEWWLGKGPRWNGETYTWTFPKGPTVAFGYLNHEDDYVQYGSTEYQYIGFDEVTEIREFDYRFMFSRLRRTRAQEAAGIPLRVRAAANPIGPGVVWVKRRFNLPEGHVPGRPFVPASLEDNIHLDRESYERSLARLDPVTRRRLREGDWEIRDLGLLFQRSWYEGVTSYPAGMRAVRYWDKASTQRRKGTDPAYTAGVLMATGGQGTFFILDIKHVQGTPKQVEDLIKQTAQLDKRRTDLQRLSSVFIYIEQEPGSSGVDVVDHYRRNVLQGYPFYADKVTGSKVDRAAGFSSASEAQNVFIYLGSLEGKEAGVADVDGYLDELEAFPEGFHKDRVDASTGAFNMLTQGGQEPLYA